jgi:hypothetical protein
VITIYVLAGGLELVGLAFAGIGFIDTWRSHGAGGSLVKAMLRSLGRVLANGLRKIGIPVRQDATVRAGSIEGKVRFGSHAMAAGYSPLPDPTVDMDGWMAAVEDKIEHLYAAAFQNARTVQKEIAERESATESLRTELTARADELERRSKAVVVDGIELQAWGWLLLFGGVILGTIGNLLSVR